MKPESDPTIREPNAGKTPHALHQHGHKGTTEKMSTKLSPATLQETVLPARGEVRTLKEILTMEGERCVDGRGTEAAAGVPGGTLGTIAAELSAAEKVTGKPVSRETVRALIRQRPVIYMHTDGHAEHALKDAILSHPTLKAFAATGVEELLAHGTRNAQANVALAELARQHIGCGHLKLIMANAEQYGARKQLVADIVEEALLHKWDSGNVEREVLEGDHGEGAVVVVKVKGGLADANAPVPVLRPSDNGEQQFFVSHPEVAHASIDSDLPKIAELLAKEGTTVDTEALRRAAQEQLGLQTNQTVGRLAQGLDVVETTIDPHHLDKTPVKYLATVPHLN